MQLSHAYDEVNFPYVIATDEEDTQVFFVNMNTQVRVQLINLKDFISSHIFDIQQTSKFAVT